MVLISINISHLRIDRLRGGYRDSSNIGICIIAENIPAAIPIHQTNV